MLDESVEDHYVHSKEPIFAQRTDISGRPGRQNVRPDLLFWALDDWSGGEGNVVFDPDMHNVYHEGSGNPRMEGRLDGKPPRYTSAHTVAGAVDTTELGSALADVTGTSEDDGTETIIGRTKVTTRLESNSGYTETGTWVNTVGSLHGVGSFSGGDNARMAEDEPEGDTSSINRTPGVSSVTVNWRVWVSDAANPYNGYATLKCEVLDGATVVATSQANYQASGTQNVAASHDISLSFTASAAVTYTYKLTFVIESGNIFVMFDYIDETVIAGAIEEVKWGGRNPADGAVLNIAFWLSPEAPWTGGNNSVAYEVRIRNATDAIDRATASGTISGNTIVNLQYTLVAGDAGADVFEYYVKKTSASDLDAIRIDKIVESIGNTHSGNLPMVVARGAVWVGMGQELIRSTDGITWTARTATNDPGGAFLITSLTANDRYIYVLYHENPTAQNDDIRVVAVTETLTGAEWTGLALTGLNRVTQPSPASIVTTPATNKLYYYMGDLFEADSTLDAAAVWGNPVHAPSYNGMSTFQAGTKTGMVALDDNSVCYFHSTPGKTTVYQYKNGAGRAIWYPPTGFTAKAMTYSDGVLYLAGGEPNALMPGMTLYALRILDGGVELLGTYRDETSSLAPVSMGSGFEGHLMIGDNLGHVFAWMPDKKSFSLVDTTTSVQEIKSTVGFLRRKIAVEATSNTSCTIYTWDPDTLDGVGDFQSDSGLFDFDIPEAEKVLHGFKIATKPLPAGASVTVWYQVDDSGTWINAGSISGTGAVFKFIDAPIEDNTVHFRNMKLRIVGDAVTATSASPTVYSLTVVAGLTEEIEVWDLTLRLKDERPNERPSNRQMSSSKLRDWLFTISEDREIVPFEDGYRYRDPNTIVPAVNVLVESPRDVIKSNAEGAVRVRLRKIGDDPEED